MHFTLAAFVHSLLWILIMPFGYMSLTESLFDLCEDLYNTLPPSNIIYSNETILRIPPPATRAIKTPVFHSEMISHEISKGMSQQVQAQLRSIAILSNGVTSTLGIQSTFFQQNSNADANLISLNIQTHPSSPSSILQRFLEVSIHPNHLSIRLRALSSESAKESELFEEMLPHNFPLRAWHKIALTLTVVTNPTRSGVNIEHSVDLIVNCTLIYSSQPLMRYIDWNLWNSENKMLDLQLGRLEGYISEAKLLFHHHLSNSNVKHRNIEPSHCLLGTKKSTLVNKASGVHFNDPVAVTSDQMVWLQTQVQQLTSQMEKLQFKVQSLEQCKCQAICKHGTTTYDIGAVWNVSTTCETCVCEGKGNVMCHPIRCSPTKCKNPVKASGDCCPICLKSCEFSNLLMEHGEVIQKNCRRCECNNGQGRCFKVECPSLTCQPYFQVMSPDGCCKECREENFCGQPGVQCPLNSNCVNLRTAHVCRCHKGYLADNLHNATSCTDINECSAGQEMAQGKVKDVRKTKYVATCDPSMICVNTPGSYKCVCPEGYQIDSESEKCEPVCDSPCENGGQCIAPNVCQCQNGFHGATCALDINECALEVHQCHPYSECVNIPGSYYCKCRGGFTSSNHLSDSFSNVHVVTWTGEHCSDVDECSGEMGVNFTCNPNRRCINRPPGSYECQCKFYSRCDRSCYVRRGDTINVYGHGKEYTFPDVCKRCNCKKGRFTCSPVSCDDCSQQWINKICCPNCQKNEAGQSLFCLFKPSGDMVKNETSDIKMSINTEWIYNCSTCTCALDVHTGIPKVMCSPLPCPTLSCKNPRPMAEGHCCPVCDMDPPSTCINSSSLLFANSSSSLSSTSSSLSSFHSSLNSSTDLNSSSPAPLNCSLPLKSKPSLTVQSVFPHGHQWVIESLSINTGSRQACIICKCQNGRICCSQRSRC